MRQSVSFPLVSLKDGCAKFLLPTEPRLKHESVLFPFWLQRLPLHPHSFLLIIATVPDEVHPTLSLLLQSVSVRQKQRFVIVPTVL